MCTKQKHALIKKRQNSIYIYKFMLDPTIYLISETRQFFT